MFFKASRKNSRSFGAYRQIVKRGGESFDSASSSDDVIILTIPLINPPPSSIHIDCNKKTGEFRLYF